MKVINSKEDLENLKKKRGQFSKLNDTVIEEYENKRQNEIEEDDDLDDTNYEHDDDDDEENDNHVEKKKIKKAKSKKIMEADRTVQKEILKKRMNKLVESKTLSIQAEKLKEGSSEHQFSTKFPSINEELIENLKAELKDYKTKYSDSAIKIQLLNRKVEELQKKLDMYKQLNEELHVQLYNYQQSEIKQNVIQQGTVGKKELDKKGYDEDYEKFVEETTLASSPNNEQNGKTSTEKKNKCDSRSEEVHDKDDPEEFSPSLLAFKNSHKKRSRILYSPDSDEEENLTEKYPIEADHQICGLKSAKRQLFSDNFEDDIHEKELQSNDYDAKEVQNQRSAQNEQEENFAEVDATEDDRNISQLKLAKTQKDNNSVKNIEYDKKNDESNEDKAKSAQQSKDLSANFSKFRERWSKNVDDKTVTMIYLNNQFSIPLTDWKAYRDSSDKYFIKQIVREMYTYPQELSTRCVKEADNKRTPKGTRKRKAISPLKIETLKRCLQYYHQKKGVQGKVLEQKVSQLNKILTEDINSAIKHVRSSESSV